MAAKGVLSARGERVDFDLLKIKQQIAAAPPSATVKAREDFVDRKFKRRLSKQIREVVAPVEVNTQPNEEENQPIATTEAIIDQTTKTKKDK